MEQDNKKIEALVNKLMRAEGIEKAPTDFTDKVMSEINALSETKTIVYSPLIPKYVWWFILSGFVGLVGYILYKDADANTSLLERYNLPEVTLNPLESLTFDFSSTLMYAMVLLAIMVAIQIPLLKQYVNNRMSY